MARICLINPRFPTSFWGFNHALPLFGKKSNMPVLALPTLAGLTPPGHEVVLIDEGVEDIDFDEVAKFDIVGLTGMTVQRDRMVEILRELKARGVFTVVGGPWVTVAEGWEKFNGLIDVIFAGEAEETWPRFLEDWQARCWKLRYEQAEKTDMTRVPLPRFDLVKFDRYLMGCVQTSRGCPYQCEFCDIIVIFGRKPRVKTPQQVVAEVEAQYREGVRMIFLVDDNFIGNKKSAKVILRALIDWQRKRGYPVAFTTEASLDLAEDDELMRLMTEAGLVSVFVGIESPDEEALKETKKYQNVRGSLLERVHRIQAAGLEVFAGMIVGFDSDDAGVFDRQFDFLDRARIPVVMSGMLSAIPKTPLYARLEKEGRLDNDAADDPRIATNVIPRQMTREQMRDGWVALMQRLYDPEAYFARLRGVYIDGQTPVGRAKMDWLRRKRPVTWVAQNVLITLASLRLLYRIWTDPRTRPFRAHYKRFLRQFLAARRPLRHLMFFGLRSAMHAHFAIMTRQMASGETRLVNT
jgi:radical SAM superfamily enzyme YgiQ (UPF0313 family)